MKKILIILFVLSACGNLYAQSRKPITVDTTKIKMGKSVIMIIKDENGDGDYDYDFNECDTIRVKDDYAGISFDIGLNGYMAPDYSLGLPTGQDLLELDYQRSRVFGFTIQSRGLNLIRDRLYLTSGLGVSWNGYFFNNNVSLSTSNDSTSFSLDSITYNKYKLRVTYLQVPIILGTRIGNIKAPLGVQVGIVGGLKLSSMVKQKYNINESKHKDKIRDNFNINPFKLDAIARISIKNVGLFARYSFTTLFEKDKAPELYPFSVGLTFGEFSGKTR